MRPITEGKQSGKIARKRALAATSSNLRCLSLPYSFFFPITYAPIKFLWMLVIRRVLSWVLVTNWAALYFSFSHSKIQLHSLIWGFSSHCVWYSEPLREHLFPIIWNEVQFKKQFRKTGTIRAVVVVFCFDVWLSSLGQMAQLWLSYIISFW